MKCGIVNLFVLIPVILELKQGSSLLGKPRNNTLSNSESTGTGAESSSEETPLSESSGVGGVCVIPESIQ